MTRFSGFSIGALALGAALTLSAGFALAAENTVSADQILHALKPRPLTRGLSLGPQTQTPRVDAAAQAQESSFINSVRNRQTRSLSMGERDQLAAIADSKPKIDLEIQFDYNSAQISKQSLGAVQELGKALSDPSMRGTTFMVGGHTDGIGGEAFNQGLSERRAETIKQYMVEKFGLAGRDLVSVGYGKTKLKDAANPSDPINRRVQVVNMETNKTAAAQ